MIRRELLLALFGGLAALTIPRLLYAPRASARVAVVPLGKRARALALAHKLPMLGDDITAASSVVLMGCLGGRTGLEETYLYRHVPGRAIVLMPMPFEGRRRQKFAEEAMSTLREADMQVDVIDVMLGADLTLGDARKLREDALMRQCLASLA